ncbi:FecCD family ABC transporter permease [Leucobacter sp. M11]|uniref:FecCD family ABC transporter permease n=1 Tax=Leucobacter sp. M11 TaxID=2993565 RepID=UPI002D8059D0|nr:iron chelate uptake ABC transporter family permease subunit [Leucobacter sp. M11]MEB4616326.1 iron chelate uptake ABC transporter family permease subunit [Leucobacter sp. M11]
MTEKASIAPPGTWWIRLGRGHSVLLPRKTSGVGLALLGVCIALAVVGIGLGASQYSYADVIQVLQGTGSGPAQLVIVEWRLPRIILAISDGSALGIAGSLFQAITRNPLGSPDLIGFTMGAQTGILLAVLVFGGTLLSVSISALVGGLSVGAVIALLSLRGGFGGFRLILAGIALSSMLGSLNRWLIVQADPDTAFGALRAVTGSLANADWALAVPCSVGILLVTLVVLTRSRGLRSFQLGPDIAQALGTSVNRTQISLLILGTALVALATMAAGPIAFVALIAPHLARLLTQQGGANVFLSGVVGAALLLSADLIGQTMLDSLPVGVITGAGGGLYFMGLLLMQSRRRTR